jgi:rubredoxin
MICSCGFDNSGGRLPENCLGCGVPLRPPDDHKRPTPGFDVHESEGPYIVTAEERERDPERLAGIYVVHRSDIRWGRGIGAECYGYYQRGLSATVDVAEYSDDGETECPECGDDRALYKTAFDGCVAATWSLRCSTCDHVYYEHYDY